MRGILYGVGVGPGDPGLLTAKAIRTIRRCPVIAAPASGGGDGLALRIAGEYIDEGKTVLLCDLPMTRDEQALRRSRERAADELCAHLDGGRDVAFLTLGDPSVYSTYMYLHRIILERGYEARMIPGVPSFCAAAAELGVSLCDGGEPLHILPASYGGVEKALRLEGTKVLMKSGRELGRVLELLEERGMLEKAMLVERCGLPGQRVVREMSGSGEAAGYFSLIVVKE